MGVIIPLRKRAGKRAAGTPRVPVSGFHLANYRRTVKSEVGLWIARQRERPLPWCAGAPFNREIEHLNRLMDTFIASKGMWICRRADVVVGSHDNLVLHSLAAHVSDRLLATSDVLVCGEDSPLLGSEIRHHGGEHDLATLEALGGLMMSAWKEAGVDDSGRCRMKAWAASRILGIRETGHAMNGASEKGGSIAVRRIHSASGSGYPAPARSGFLPVREPVR